MPARCFLMALKGIKWLSDKNQSSDKCLYFQTPLSVASLIFFLASMWCPKIPLTCYQFLSWQLGHTKVIWSTLKFVVSCCVVSWEWAFEWRRYFTGLIFSKLVPTTDAKLPARNEIDLHHCFTNALSRPAQWWRKLYCTTKQTLVALIPGFCIVCLLHYANFILQATNAVKEAMDSVWNLLLEVVHLKPIRMSTAM